MSKMFCPLPQALTNFYICTSFYTLSLVIYRRKIQEIYFKKKQGRKSSVKLIQHNTSGETSDVELVVRQFFLLYLFISQLWPLWFLRNVYTSGSKFVVCRMNCWRRVNEIQLRRVVLYKVNTLKKNVYFISKGPPKYNFIEIKRSKDQGFQIYLTVSMMTKVNELGTNIYKQVVYYQ